MKDVQGWVQPLSIAALRVIELLDLLLKHGENAARRTAGLEPVSEWVFKKIVLCSLFVCFQCIVENWLEFGGCRSRVSMRHKGGSEELRYCSRAVGDGESWERATCLTNVQAPWQAQAAQQMTDERRSRAYVFSCWIACILLPVPTY
jgi:hypothetical protein